MKIIFLDIDGVLNSEKYYRSVDRKRKNWSRFDPLAVLMIKKLIDEFSLKIVITSTWRFGAVEMLNIELIKSGLKQYLYEDWKTPQTSPSHRGKEIKMWLDNHPVINEYVIIDDDENILKEHMLRFVQTDIKEGLNQEHYYKAREVLLD